jgi:hypothetical protein
VCRVQFLVLVLCSGAAAHIGTDAAEYTALLLHRDR